MSGFFENGITPAHVMLLAAMIFACMLVELGYMLFANPKKAKQRINRRMMAKEGKNQLSQKNILIQLRKERGLSEDGMMILPLRSLNRLITRADLSITIPQLSLIYIAYILVVNAGVYVYWQSQMTSIIAFPIIAFLIPFLYLNRRGKKKAILFSAQLPEAIDLIARSLKAGHPVPVAIAMVGREMPDPIGTEFGMLSDEVTYGSDLVTALNNLYERVKVDDLPLLISSISIQSTTGGNLRDILDGLATVIRDRSKMKRKIRAISAEGRMSAIFLSALPILLFIALKFISPSYYSEIWENSLSYYLVGGTIFWSMAGNALILKMVSFKF